MLVNYIINRPIAVCAVFLSVLAIGFYGWTKIPKSLMPKVDPPEIIIEIRQNGISSEVMERTILKQVRQSVIGSLGLKDIKSEAVSGFGRVELGYEFGSKMDIALLEVNEKIDRIMFSLPPNIDRPTIRKKKPTDIPAVRLHLASSSLSLIDLSELAKFEFIKRFEQLNGVAQIEVNGEVQSSIQLQPKMDRILSAGLNLTDLTGLIDQANLPISQILVRNGIYEYLIQVENILKNEDSIKKLLISTNDGQLIELGQLFDIEKSYLNPINKHFFNDNQGIVLAIYNQPKADLLLLRKAIKEILAQLQQDFPSIEFHLSQDQALLLDENINQLYLSAFIATFFAFVIFFISSNGKRLPLILGIIIPSSIFISMGLLWILDLTLNIITLSGFILGIGLLVDNIIILIEEINQNRRNGVETKEACILSVKNIFPALLSSTLTNLCVFVPLIALKGIAGDLFKEQAFALIIILSVSLILTFILIPTFYNLWIKSEITDRHWLLLFRGLVHKSTNKVTLLIITALIGIGIFSASQLNSESLPDYFSSAFQIRIVWNEPLSLEENEARIRHLLNEIDAEFLSVDIGVNGIRQNTISFFDEANIYIQSGSHDVPEELQDKITSTVLARYPKASITKKKATNTFEMIFFDDEPLAEARIRKKDGQFFLSEDITNLLEKESKGILDLALTETYKIKFFNDRIERNSFEYPEMVNHLKNLTDEHIITSIKNIDVSVPITINLDDLDYFFSKDSVYYNLSSFYQIDDTSELRTIKADLSGPYISFISDSFENVKEYANNVNNQEDFLFDLRGSLLTKSKNMQRLALASILGAILLYLILVAQFESFIQPLIIFSITPLALLGSLIGLHVSGGTINIMSIIGIVATLGIIVNDSILKVDAINRNMKEGHSVAGAIQKAKDERFKPILMTSLSTILAMTPILFSGGIASDIQKPLAIVIIGGLTVGTWSSIVMLPVIYGFEIKSRDTTRQ